MHTVLPDNPDGITAAIKDMLTAGMETVFCTGGMSVDPDDRTPLAIKNTGNRIVSYGAPVLPGAMFLLSSCCRLARVRYVCKTDDFRFGFALFDVRYGIGCSDFGAHG